MHAFHQIGVGKFTQITANRVLRGSELDCSLCRRYAPIALDALQEEALSLGRDEAIAILEYVNHSQSFAFMRDAQLYALCYFFNQA